MIRYFIVEAVEYIKKRHLGENSIGECEKTFKCTYKTVRYYKNGKLLSSLAAFCLVFICKTHLTTTDTNTHIHGDTTHTHTAHTTHSHATTHTQTPHILTYTHTYAHKHTPKQTYTHRHTHTNTYTHTHTQK